MRIDLHAGWIRIPKASRPKSVAQRIAEVLLTYASSETTVDPKALVWLATEP